MSEAGVRPTADLSPDQKRWIARRETICMNAEISSVWAEAAALIVFGGWLWVAQSVEWSNSALLNTGHVAVGISCITLVVYSLLMFIPRNKQLDKLGAYPGGGVPPRSEMSRKEYWLVMSRLLILVAALSIIVYLMRN